MKNFTYSSPTKIHFGNEQIVKLNDELNIYRGKTILLVYGMGSIKRNGIFDKIVQEANNLNIKIIEENNVSSNPDISSVRSGIKKCIEHNVEFILAAGGGSVIDCAKAIAFGIFAPSDVWDVYLRKADSTKALPLGVIITLAATGTETNGNSVISNRELDDKRSVAYPFSIPQFAIIDPSYTLTVNRHHTIAGSMDVILHILEQYFSNTLRTETSDYMSIGVIKSVIENTNRILEGDNSYDNRSNISWASTIGLNWILGVDKQGDWATHRLSYALTKEYGTTHGFALVLIYTSWMRVALKYNPETMSRKLNLLGLNLFQTSSPESTIESFERLFNGFGANTNFKDEKIVMDESKMNDLIENVLALGEIGTVVKIDKIKAKEIFVLARGGKHGNLL